MEYKELGNTGVRIPEIGLGTWNYRGGTQPIRTAIALGAGFLDTAESYGTEEVVGEAIRGYRERVFLATKALPRHFKYADLLRAADRSLARLRVDHIDLYQLHWPNYTVPIQETMAAMEALVDQGKVRFVGVSNFSVGDLRNAQPALSRHRIVSNQVRYSLAERTIETSLLRYCQQSGITIIAYSPLAHGLHHIREKDPGGILAKVAEMTDRTEAQVALNWCLAKEAVTVIPKADSVARVTENCLASGWRLSSQHMALLTGHIRFRRRGPTEMALRRWARHLLQELGRQS